jgi:hypothetical protein
MLFYIGLNVLCQSEFKKAYKLTIGQEKLQEEKKLKLVNKGVFVNMIKSHLPLPYKLNMIKSHLPLPYKLNDNN